MTGDDIRNAKTTIITFDGMIELIAQVVDQLNADAEARLGKSAEKPSKA